MSLSQELQEKVRQLITLIAGSRDFPNQKRAEEYIFESIRAYCTRCVLEYGKPNFSIITGGARGTDTVAIKACKSAGVRAIVVRPKYERYGAGATHRRNDFMLGHAGRVVIFWHGKYERSGTASVILKAILRGLPLVIHRYDKKSKYDDLYYTFTEIKPDVFINKAPWDWLKSCGMTEKKMTKLFPYYVVHHWRKQHG